MLALWGFKSFDYVDESENQEKLSEPHICPVLFLIPFVTVS